MATLVRQPVAPTTQARRHGGILAGTALGVALATTAQAVPIGVAAKKLIVIDKLTAANKAKVVYVAKDAAVTKGPGTDEASITAFMVVALATPPDELGELGVFLMSSGSWVVNNDSVAKYVNNDAPDPAGSGAVKVGVIKPGKLLKVVAKGLGDSGVFGNPLVLDIDTPPTESVRTLFEVTNGAQQNTHCTEFPLASCTHKVIAGGTGAKLVCKNGVPDATCAALCDVADVPANPTLGLPAGQFVDCGDGTVFDTRTQLKWEKKNGDDGLPNPGNLHDVDNRYTWAGECTISHTYCQPTAAATVTCTAQTGGALGCAECGGGEGTCNVDPTAAGAVTTIWDWVHQVNAASFGGHADWRIATSAGTPSTSTGDPEELRSLIDVMQGVCGGSSGACVDPIVGPTAVGAYWSASTDPAHPDGAIAVPFDSASTYLVSNKGGRYYARAVRPGP